MAKLTTLIPASLALAALASSAGAAGSNNFRLNGTLSGKCKVEFVCSGSATCTSLRFAAKLASYDKNTPNDSTGTIKWSCNMAGQLASIVFTSRNNGVLMTQDGKNSLPYVVSLAGQSISGFVRQPLNTPKTGTGTAMTAMTVYTGTLTLNTTPCPNLQAGSYEDMISVTITPSGL